jgi:hypothetical protein
MDIVLTDESGLVTTILNARTVAYPLTLLDVANFGAVTDAQSPEAMTANVSAFQAAFNQAKATKSQVIARKGRKYWLNKSIQMDSITFHNESELWFNDGRLDVSAGLIVRGNGPKLDLSGSVNSVATKRGGGEWGQMGVCVSAVDFDIGGGGRVSGAACVGVYLQSAARGYVHDLTVTDTKADSYHNTVGTNYVDFRRLKTLRSADDCFAVVSYDKKGAICHHITLDGFEASEVKGGRGLTVVGGEDIVYQNARLTDVSRFGLYIASEGNPYYTRGVRRVTARNVAIDGCGLLTMDTGDGLLLMGRSGVDDIGAPTSVDGPTIKLANVTINRARRYGALVYKWMVVPGMDRSGVTFTNCGWGNVWREV